MLTDYIEFLERFSIDRKYYGRLKSKHGTQVWEFSWNRGGSVEKPWGLKDLGAEVWHYFSRLQFLALLNLHEIDLQDVKKGFEEKIKSMLVFSSLMEKYAKELMGDDVVEKSVTDYGMFASSLLDSINENLEDHGEKKASEKPKQGERAQFPTLRLIKSHHESQKT